MEAILPIERWTLVDMVQAQAERQGDRQFIEFLEGGSLTFADLHEQSDQFATVLAGLGVEPGDRVMALATNSVEFLVAMIATHKRQAIFTPINTELKGALLEHQVRNSEPRVVLVDAGLVSLFEQVNTEGVGIEHTIVVEDGPDLPDPMPSALSSTTVRTWGEVVAGVTVDPASVLDTDPTDVCTIMYTSGTTGPSKGVLMPQGHCTLFAVGAAHATALTEDDHYFVCMPFFHANGLFMQVWAALVAGATATVSKRFSVSTWLDDVMACEATITNALGVMPEFIYRSPADPRDRSTKLTRVMAVPVAEEWGAGFEERFGVKLVQGFGMTEVNMIAYSDPTDPVLPGCAGRVYDDFFEVVIGDPDTDAALPPDTIGEILVRPKVPFFFNVGYYRMPDKTVEAWRNLWFHTGDAGRLDPEGRLWFVDRLKDRIRRRGENISSYEIEQVVNEHPAVVESAALGVKVEGAGGEEEVKLCVVVDGELDPVELLDFCVPRMPRHAVPRFVEIVGELDKTPSGKVRKKAMRDLGVTDTTWDRESVGYVVPR